MLLQQHCNAAARCAAMSWEAAAAAAAAAVGNFSSILHHPSPFSYHPCTAGQHDTLVFFKTIVLFGALPHVFPWPRSCYMLYSGRSGCRMWSGGAPPAAPVGIGLCMCLLVLVHHKAVGLGERKVAPARQLPMCRPGRGLWVHKQESPEYGWRNCSNCS